jgi:putative DNA primase/helicase
MSEPKGDGRRAARAALVNPKPIATATRHAVPVHTEIPGFTMARDGLFRQVQGRGAEPAEVFISAPFDCLAEGRDAEGNGWALLLRWQDRDGRDHHWLAPRAMMNGEGNELRARLAGEGLSMSPHPAARAALLEFLARQHPTARVRITPRTGWHEGQAGGAAFVLPHTVIGQLPAGERVMLDATDVASPYRSRGSLEEWRRGIAAKAVGNRLLLLSLSIAFAPSLLAPLGVAGGGVHLVGQAQRGKSTALRCAAGVWGAPDGALPFVRTWRATANGLEGLAAQSNDGLLPLDEIGEAEPREVGPCAYLLGNGSAKARAGRDGRARPGVTWRLLFLSTGEKSLSTIMAEARAQAAAGQEVRLVDLSADAGRGMGLFENTHGAANPGAFAEGLTASMQGQHGTAGPAFLEWLVPKVSGNPAWARETLAPRILDFLGAYLPPGADGQVRSVCRRFALIALGGELATEAGVTGWPEGTAWEAAGACFQAWLAGRGSAGAREDIEALARVRSAIAMHSQARMEVWKDREAQPGEVSTSEASPPHEARSVGQRLGWRRWVPNAESAGGGVWRFYFSTAGWREITSGLDPTMAAKALASHGFLKPSPPKRDGTPVWSHTAKPPGFPRGVATYIVDGSIMAETEDGEAEGEKGGGEK